MVAARKKSESRHESKPASPLKFTISEGSIVLEIIEEDFRPIATRGRWSKDPKVAEVVKRILDTVDSGKSIKVKLADPELLDQLAMHARHHVTTRGKFRLRAQKLPDGYMRLYGERKEKA